MSDRACIARAITGVFPAPASTGGTPLPGLDRWGGEIGHGARYPEQMQSMIDR